MHNQGSDDEAADPNWVPITADEAARHVNNKSTLFESLLRNDFLMMNYKDAICTYDFLEKVYDKKIWLPKAS